MQTGKDIILLKHMLDAINEAIGFSEDRDRIELETDRQLMYSLVRCLEIVGEAASKISIDLKNRHAFIPWSHIVGMRNRLIHAYFDINPDIVWRTVKSELPDLKSGLESILKSM